jgi:hypothetical protein
MARLQFRKHISFLKRRGASHDHDEDNSIAAGADNHNVRSTESVHARPPSLPARDSSGSSTKRLSNANTIPRQLGNPAEAGTGTLTNVHGQDPVGLKVIYRPQPDRQVDIVFVHGLGGSSRMTWSKYRDLDYFWPLKFLALEPSIKDDARILTFGYNANFRPGSGKNKMTVLDFAKELLFELKYAQDETVPEPEDLGMGQAWAPYCSSPFVLSD